MKPLGQLLRAIRLNKNMSEQKAARRCGFGIGLYNQFEKDPGKVPANQLIKIFRAIDMTHEECLDFHRVAQLIYGSQRINTSRSHDNGSRFKTVDTNYMEPEVSTKSMDNVLDFVEPSGIRKDKKLKKTDQG